MIQFDGQVFQIRWFNHQLVIRGCWLSPAPSEVMIPCGNFWSIKFPYDTFFSVGLFFEIKGNSCQRRFKERKHRILWRLRDWNMWGICSKLLKFLRHKTEILTVDYPPRELTYLTMGKFGNPLQKYLWEGIWFQLLFFSSILGEMIQFYYFFRWLKTTT